MLKKIVFIHFDKAWFAIIYNEFNKPYFKNIFKLLSFKKTHIQIYPDIQNIFNAFKLTKFNDVKIIIIGQDPYCKQNQADGLAFSVKQDTVITSSLKNIYQELKNDIGVNKKYTNTDLTSLAEQGILLLNSILTVEENKPASHANIGWETLTDNIIKIFSENNRKIIFVLLGQYAQNKIKIINSTKNIIILSSHPSVKSAYKGFLGSRIFTKINLHLKLLGTKSINWNF